MCRVLSFTQSERRNEYVDTDVIASRKISLCVTFQSAKLCVKLTFVKGMSNIFTFVNLDIRV